MMYIHSNNEIDKRINVSKIANDISTLGDNSTAAGCKNRLITVFVAGFLAEFSIKINAGEPKIRLIYFGLAVFCRDL